MIVKKPTIISTLADQEHQADQVHVQHTGTPVTEDVAAGSEEDKQPDGPRQKH